MDVFPFHMEPDEEVVTSWEGDSIDSILPKPRLLPRFPAGHPLHSVLRRNLSQDEHALPTLAGLASAPLSRCSSSDSSTSSRNVRFAMTEVTSVYPTHSAKSYDRAPYRRGSNECPSVSLEIPSHKTSEAWIKCVERNAAAIPLPSSSSSSMTFKPRSPSPPLYFTAEPAEVDEDDDISSPLFGRMTSSAVPGLVQDDYSSASSSSEADDHHFPSHSHRLRMTPFGRSPSIHDHDDAEDDDDTLTQLSTDRFGICALNGNWSRASLYNSCDALGGF